MLRGIRHVLLACLAGASLAAPLSAQVQWRQPWPDPANDRPDPRQRIQFGDDPAWARPDFDDRDWQPTNTMALPTRAGVYWVRIHLRHDRRFDAMAASAVAAFELYWDGRLVGGSGKPGANAAAEVPGPIYNLIRLPDDLARPGDHVLALRISSYHGGFPNPRYQFLYGFGDLPTYVAARTREAAWALSTVGACLVGALGFAGLWLFVERRRVWLLFAGVFFAALLVLLVDTLRVVSNYPYPWHYPLKVGTFYAILLLGMLLLAFVQEFFRLRPRWPGHAVILVAALAIWPKFELYFTKSLILALVAFGVLLLHAGAAVALRRRSALPVLLGFLVSAVVAWRGPAAFLGFQRFPLFFGAPALGCLVALGRQYADERRAAQAATLTAARLEIELLRKNLQPHFLLNTLTAVTEVIEQNPAEAVRFVEDLAGEFRTLAAMSGERLVPLARELELCTAHLKVVARRTGHERTLTVRDVDPGTAVPPALFLTLIENALVHQRDPQGPAFALSGGPDGAEVSFCFRSRGAIRPPGARPAGGTGMRYVRARLEESFPGRWALEQGPVDDGWETRLRWSRPREEGA